MSAKHLAHGLASLGRNGDSVLVHMQPHEVAGLDALARSQGTKLTINPNTGLPEAFSLGGFFSSLLPTLIGGGLGAAGAPLWAGMAAGAATGALTNKKNPFMGALMGGLGGYGGFGLGEGLKNMGQFATSAGANTADPLVQDQLKQAAMQQGVARGEMLKPFTPEIGGANLYSNPVAVGATGSTGQVGGANLVGNGSFAQPTVNTAITQNQIPSLIGRTADVADTASPFAQNLSQSGQNLQKLAEGSPGAWDTYKTALGNGKPISDLALATKIGMPLGGAALGGLEPADIYGKPLKSTLDKYDPYATLNLAQDTGLRLYAAGGPVSFADGGDAMKGGGADAMEGAGLMPVDVSDINAKYGYNRDAGGTGLAGIVGMGGQPRIAPPMVGAFADADTVNAARDAYERQLQQSMIGRGGMANLMGPRSAYAQQVNAQRTGTDNSGNPITRMTLSNVAPSASTAKTADTALTANPLNLNKQYAQGGTITSGGIRDLYGTQDDQANGAVLSRDGFGLGRLQKMYEGGISGYKKGGYLDGPGDGMSDSIPAVIQDKQPARLADGEFVVPADVVSHIGNGSSKAGAKQLYSMMDRVRKARTGTKKQGKRINALKHLPA